jgi:hypothetical protein
VSVSILLRCDVCDATVQIPAPDDFDTTVMRDADDRTLLVETMWMRWPKGWDLSSDADRCPEHAT